RHGVEDCLRPAVLQRPGDAVEHADPVVPLLDRGRSVRLPGAPLLRDRGRDARARAGGPLLAVYEQISANKRKTAILFVLAVVLLGGVGYAIGLLSNSGPAGLVIALVVAVAMSVGSYLY